MRIYMIRVRPLLTEHSPTPPATITLTVLRLVGRVWCAYAWRSIYRLEQWFTCKMSLLCVCSLVPCGAGSVPAGLSWISADQRSDWSGAHPLLWQHRHLQSHCRGQLGHRSDWRRGLGKKGWGVVGRFGDRSMSACHCVLLGVGVCVCVRWRAWERYLVTGCLLPVNCTATSGWSNLSSMLATCIFHSVVVD